MFRSTLALIYTLAAMAPSVDGACLDASALWCDEFNTPGRPNPEYWGYDLGAGGWGNSESQTYTKENAAVGADGFLHIEVLRDDAGAYTSSRVKTEDKVSFLYCRIEASIKIPNLEGGLWPAIWMLGTNFADIGWPLSGEIDIAEWGNAVAIAENRLHTTASSAMHWDENGHAFGTDEIIVVPPPDLDQEFHTYAVDWTPDNITFYLEDQVVFTKNIVGFEEFHKPFHLLVNVAVGGSFTGIFEPTSGGGELLVDWIRAFDNGSGSSVTVEPCGEDCNANDDENGNDDESGASSIFGRRHSWSVVGLAGVVLLALNML